MATRDVAEASRILRQHGVPASPILEVDSPVLREQALARGVAREVSMPDGSRIALVDSPIRLPGSAEVGIGLPSALGEDTERVLRDWLGMPAAEIAALRDAGVLR